MSTYALFASIKLSVPFLSLPFFVNSGVLEKSSILLLILTNIFCILLNIAPYNSGNSSNAEYVIEATIETETKLFLGSGKSITSPSSSSPSSPSPSPSLSLSEGGNNVS